jgi:hypothetical protein
MSRQGISILKLTIIATAALTEGRAVTVAGAVPAAAATCLGFADATSAIGEAVNVNVLGTTPAEAGAAIAAGAALELDASGRVITKAAGVTVGRALEAAGALGAFIEIVLIPN